MILAASYQSILNPTDLPWQQCWSWAYPTHPFQLVGPKSLLPLGPLPPLTTTMAFVHEDDFDDGASDATLDVDLFLGDPDKLHILAGVPLERMADLDFESCSSDSEAEGEEDVDNTLPSTSTRSRLSTYKSFETDESPESPLTPLARSHRTLTTTLNASNTLEEHEHAVLKGLAEMSPLLEGLMPGQSLLSDTNSLHCGNQPVVIRRLTSQREASIFKFLDEEPRKEDPWNPSVHLLAAFNSDDSSTSHAEQKSFVVFESLIAYDTPPFETVLEALNFLQQVIQWSVFLHENGIIHGAIKSENIMMQIGDAPFNGHWSRTSWDVRYYLTDFSPAAFVKDAQQDLYFSDLEDLRHTINGMFGKQIPELSFLQTATSAAQALDDFNRMRQAITPERLSDHL